MEEIVGPAILILALVAFGGLLLIANYAIIKIGALIKGRPVKIDHLFLLIGAFVGMLFAPSMMEQATFASRLAPLAFALMAGALVGGLIGLAVHHYSSRASISGSSKEEQTTAIRGRGAPAVFAFGKFLFSVVLLVCAAIVIVVRLGKMPALSPIIEHLRNLL